MFKEGDRRFRGLQVPATEAFTLFSLVKLKIWVYNHFYVTSTKQNHRAMFISATYLWGNSPCRRFNQKYLGLFQKLCILFLSLVLYTLSSHQRYRVLDSRLALKNPYRLLSFWLSVTGHLWYVLYLKVTHFHYFKVLVTTIYD